MKEKTHTTLAERIALACLQIGAIELRPNNPFRWASGTRNPIYNDNRMLLGSYENRMLVADALTDVFKENYLWADYLCATSLSGIAPALSLAQKINKPVIILQNEKLFLLSRFSKENVDTPAVGENLIVVCVFSFIIF